MKAGTFDDVLQNLRWQDHVRGFIQILVDGDCAIPGKVQNVVIFEQQMIDNLARETIVGKPGQQEATGEGFVDDFSDGIGTGHNKSCCAFFGGLY